MTALQILEELNSKNITLTVDEGLLRYKAPSGTMTDEAIRVLREHKARLIEILRAKQTTPAITVKKMTACLHGKMCRFLSLVDDRQVCRKNNQPIFDMTICPDGKWWTPEVIDKADTVQPTPCFCCGNQSFWRKKDNHDGRWICEVCHPPWPHEREIEFLQYNKPTELVTSFPANSSTNRGIGLRRD